MTPTLDAQTLWLLGAGMVGRALHVVVTFNAQPWNRQRVVETILGGFAGVVLPGIPGFSDLRPWGQIVMAMVVCYAAADFLVNFARKLAARFRPPAV